MKNGGLKLIFATLLVGLVIVAGVMAVLVMLRQEAIDTHLKVAQLHARTFADHLNQTMQSVNMAIENISVSSENQAHTGALEKTFADILLNAPHIRSVSLADDGGTIVFSSNPANIGVKVNIDAFVPTPLFDEPLLRFGKPFEGRDFADGKEILIASNTRNVTFIPVSKSISYKNRNFTALVAVNSDHFVNSYSQSLDVKTGFVDVLRIDGVALFSTDPSMKVGGLEPDTTKDLSKGGDALSFMGEHEGRQSLMAYRLAKNHPLAIAVRLDYDTTLEKWERQRLNVLIITTLLVIISASLTLVLIVRHKKQQQMEQQILRSKMEAMGEMIGMIAHQWRQPLAALSAIVANIVDAYEYDELTPEYMKKTGKDASGILQYLSKTIEEFRSFFKPQDSKAQFCVCEAVLDSVKLVLPQQDSSGIKVYYDDILVSGQTASLCPHSFTVLGYRNEFIQVLVSIFKNAKEAIDSHSTEEGFIRISILHIDEKYRIRISDNGGGIAPTTAHKIFEPYFTTKHESIGTGMGLYVAKMLIENGMGGKIDAKNISGGAEFVIELDESIRPLA